MKQIKTVFLKDTGISGEEKTDDFFSVFLGKLKEKDLQKSVQLAKTEFVGIYDKGIVVKTWPTEAVYCNVTEDDIDTIINQTLIKGKVIDELLYHEKSRPSRIVLRNCGRIDPENIREYIANRGYSGLQKMLSSMSPDEVIGELKKSKLRGRGGGGFPTWLKWDLTKKAQADEKFVICNGDEGDPGAYMDRSILEGDPHSIIEGMIICGFASGANQGYAYIRAEYPLAIERVEGAIKEAYEHNLLGDNILGSGFSFHIGIRLGAGAFVCGEETALIASIEGKRGNPRPRPPYPSVKGLWGKPTTINNVETLANIPIILDKGGDWFAGIGTDESTGTKVFALTGNVKNSGLIEVPMGTTLRQIIYDIGGGVSSGKNFKAVQTGGPSGGVIPSKYLDTRVDYESLQKLGSIMGSGGMIVMDETDCMVDVARFYLRFCVDESCGKCAPCRIGGFQMLSLLSGITKGICDDDCIDKLELISQAMANASLCGLGQTAPNPVISTLKYFKEEYLAHIQEKTCPAGKCPDLLNYTIIQDKCTRCSLCFKKCPVNAITGSREEGFFIDHEKCIKCGECYEVCRFKAIEKK